VFASGGAREMAFRGAGECRRRGPGLGGGLGWTGLDRANRWGGGRAKGPPGDVGLAFMRGRRGNLKGGRPLPNLKNNKPLRALPGPAWPTPGDLTPGGASLLRAPMEVQKPGKGRTVQRSAV